MFTASESLIDHAMTAPPGKAGTHFGEMDIPIPTVWRGYGTAL